MSNERTMWAQLRPLLKRSELIFQRIESHSTNAGIPDLVFADGKKVGFIELKFLKDWPKRETTPVRIRTFTPYQRSFLTKWSKFGSGTCFLLLRVGKKEFLVFDTFVGIGELTKQEMIEKAWLYFEHGFDEKLFCEELWNR